MRGGLVRFALLGPFEVSCAADALAIDQAKPRALLAMLVVNANTVLSAGRLIDDLWEEQPPRSAANTLQTYVHKLRGLLPPETLLTRDGGYELVVEPGSVDSKQFEEMVAGSTERGAEPRRRADALRRALALWRGDALADFAGAAWAQPEIARLEAARLAAVEQRIVADLELGRERELVGELEALVDRHPFRERFSALLMLALYRADRQTDALRVYARLRHVLVEELGVEPGEAVAELERAILRHDPELARPNGAVDVVVPLSTRVHAESTKPFVGRPLELATLGAALDDAATGGRATVLVNGEPGIGKTALAATFARSVHANGACVLYGHSDAALDIPFQPWNEALSHLVMHAPQSLLDAHAAVHGAALARLVPELVERVAVEPDVDEQLEPQRHRLFGAAADLLTRIAALAPTVIVLDDLHWSDRSSIELLHYLVARDRALEVLIVATFRDTDIGPGHVVADALAAFARLPSVHRLHLTGLAGDEVLTLLERTAGAALPDDATGLRDALMRETDGNPFFIIELLRHLVETDAVRDSDGRWPVLASLGSGPPLSIRHVIGNRVARLGSDSERALAAAAVIGRDFDAGVLELVTEIDGDRLLDILEIATAAAMLTESRSEPGSFRFAHALIRHALYQELGPARRQRLHQRVGRALEDLYGDTDAHVPDLAYHWLAAAQPADPQRALHYVQRAGDLALGALSPSDAISWYRRGLDLIGRDAAPDPRVQCALLVKLARARSIAGDADARATLLDAGTLARRIDAPDLLVAAALATARGDFNQASPVDEALTELTLAALETVGPADTEARVHLLAILMEHTAGRDWELARQHATAAVETARRIGDDRLLMEAITSTYVARAQPDTLRQRLSDTELALRIADATDSPLMRFKTRFTRYVAVTESGDIDEADRLLDEMEHIAESADLTLPHTRFQLFMTRAGRRILAGDHAGATQAAHDLFTLSDAANVPEAMTTGGALLSMIGEEQGHIASMIDQFAAAVEQNPEFAVLRAAVAYYFCEVGRLEDANAILHTEHVAGFRTIPYDINWTTGMTFYADCAAAIGDTKAAATIRAQLAPFAHAHAYNGLTSLGALGRPVGRLDSLLGDFDNADGHFRAALTLNAKLRAPYPTARTQLDYAELLLRRPAPDRPAAAALAHDAAATAGSHGYGGLEQRAHTLLDTIATA